MNCLDESACRQVEGTNFLFPECQTNGYRNGLKVMGQATVTGCLTGYVGIKVACINLARLGQEIYNSSEQEKRGTEQGKHKRRVGWLLSGVSGVIGHGAGAM